MHVSFQKLGHRRYGVYVRRDRAPDLWMRGPGYDDELPHDVLHFVAEAEFGLDGAVFGDVAAGGHAKLFLPVDTTQIPKLWRQKRMHAYVLPEGGRSEQIAGLLEQLWHRRRHGTPLAEWFHARASQLDLDHARVARALAILDDLADEWSALQVGGSLTLEWPRPEGRRRHPPRQRQRNRSRQAARPSRQ